MWDWVEYCSNKALSRISNLREVLEWLSELEGKQWGPNQHHLFNFLIFVFPTHQQAYASWVLRGLFSLSFSSSAALEGGEWRIRERFVNLYLDGGPGSVRHFLMQSQYSFLQGNVLKCVLLVEVGRSCRRFKWAWTHQSCRCTIWRLGGERRGSASWCSLSSFA